MAARLIAAQTPLIAGQTAELGIDLAITPGWHVYWNGQNDTGLPVTFTPHFPQGVEPGSILWPGPMRHVGKGDILDHIYEDHVTLIVPVKIADDVPAGPVTLTMDLSWLVCKNVCLPEEATVELTIPVAAADGTTQPTPEASLFERTRARLPRPIPADGSIITTSWRDRTLHVTSTAGGRIEFYPGPESSGIHDLINTGVSDVGRLALQFTDDDAPRARGVVALWPAAGGDPVYYDLQTSGRVRGYQRPARDTKEDN